MLKKNDINHAYFSNRKERTFDTNHSFLQPLYSNLLGSLEKINHRSHKINKIKYCQLSEKVQDKLRPFQVNLQGQKNKKMDNSHFIISDKKEDKYRIRSSMFLKSQNNSRSIVKKDKNLKKYSQNNLFTQETLKIVSGTCKAMTMTIRTKSNTSCKKIQSSSIFQDYLSKSNLKWSNRKSKIKGKQKSKTTVFVEDSEKIQPWSYKRRQSITQ